jgi:predicted class III extradiol MEMO1 family dioxygenase
VQIVSILVPYMDWDTLDSLAADLSGALADIVTYHSWQLGWDLAFVISSDAVHYGDSDWGGSNYAAFGTDLRGYGMAVDRDTEIAGSLLCDRVEPERLKTFLYTMVEEADVTRYRITWCGRFSIPLGLDAVSRLAASLGGPPLAGFMLDYGTSVSEASLDVTGLGGLGPTAPNNFHHFVGYAAIGYR